MKTFKEKVLDIVRKIPRGKTLTYGEVAQKAGNAKAARAVGTYMRQNYDETVPCHRVLRSDGKIGNYNRGGEKAKRALLIKEGAIVAAFLLFFLLPFKTFAAATLPSTNVWYIPADVSAGTVINLNALVYNNQPTDATVTVTFKTSKATIGVETATVPVQTAKTITAQWTMPSVATAVTASVTAATDKNKKTLSPLLGTLGTIMISPTASSVQPVAVSSSQFTNWVKPWLTKVEAFRLEQATGYTTLRDKTRLALGITPGETKAPVTDAIPPLKVDNPLQYLTLIYATAMAAFFSSAALFYTGTVLIVLLLLRFIFNLFF